MGFFEPPMVEEASFTSEWREEAELARLDFDDERWIGDRREGFWVDSTNRH